MAIGTSNNDRHEEVGWYGGGRTGELENYGRCAGRVPLPIKHNRYVLYDTTDVVLTVRELLPTTHNYTQLHIIAYKL